MASNMQPQGNTDSATHPTRPARSWPTYTPSGDVIALAPRGVMLEADGTATLVDVDGNTMTPTLTAWTIFPFSVQKVTAASGTIRLIY